MCFGGGEEEAACARAVFICTGFLNRKAFLEHCIGRARKSASRRDFL